MAEKSKRTTYQIEGVDSSVRPWAVVEKSPRDKVVLRTFVSHQDARRFLAGLKKSATQENENAPL